MSKQSYTNEEKEHARKTDIREIGEAYGLTFKKEGKYDRCIEHDSLILKGQSYYWNSKGVKGHGGLSFCIDVLDMDFKEAMSILTQDGFSQYKNDNFSIKEKRL
ncbi:hypothetical protein [Staphylococcus aureus]